jgi:hypothetical protein
MALCFSSMAAAYGLLGRLDSVRSDLASRPSDLRIRSCALVSSGLGSLRGEGNAVPTTMGVEAHGQGVSAGITPPHSSPMTLPPFVAIPEASLAASSSKSLSRAGLNVKYPNVDPTPCGFVAGCCGSCPASVGFWPAPLGSTSSSSSSQSKPRIAALMGP